MEIKSILDNDLYKFSMGYAYMKMYPDAEGQFVFSDRNHTSYDHFTVQLIQEAINQLGQLQLTDEECKWATQNIPYIPQFYWEWLKGFRFDPSKVSIVRLVDGSLSLTVTDKLYKATLYEVPILAIISAIRNSTYVYDKGTMYNKLDEKIHLSNECQLYFSEFGTRRRFNYEVQHDVVKELSQRAHFCTGTSNVHLAMKFGMKPIGTVAHEWIMFHGANFGYKMANYQAFEAWTQVFDGSLGIALTDTYGTDIFFRNFSLKHAKLFDGLRQDSGDELEFVNKAVHRYKELGINPLLKTIVFSNALTFPKFAEITHYCKGKIGMCAAGIGTNLSNDVGCKPANIVMKLMQCRMNSKQTWADCIKLSDDAGKHMGDPKEIEICKYEIGK
jgi:nicotinate phosphoribosyltransferase